MAHAPRAEPRRPVRPVWAVAGEAVIETVIRLSGVSAILFVVAIFFFIFREAAPVLFSGSFDLGEFLTSVAWYPTSASNVRYGAFALTSGTEPEQVEKMCATLDAHVPMLAPEQDEAILRETAPIEKGLGFIRVLYVVAPLLGLLGTVVGMIATFQMITLFGSGDPRMMAGGISTALVTTVLGLVVAIPLTLVHSYLQGLARALVQVLEEQAAGMIARLAEQQR